MPSEKTVRTGRPAKDRLGEQQRIYQAALPILRRDGVRRLSMRDVAQAAHLSPGGLYHYFSNKRALALHGLDVDARDRLCRDFREQAGATGADTPEGRLEAYLELSVRLLAFVGPAVRAAVELGMGELRAQLDRGMDQNLGELRRVLDDVAPGATRMQLLALAGGIRRLTLGALMDAGADLDRIREQLRLLILRAGTPTD
jgi:AcrR family transcriptional regulator